MGSASEEPTLSALRLSTPDGLRLIDLGPGAAMGHVHDGGRLARPEPGPNEITEHRRERLAEYQRRRRARLAGRIE
jgi:hypothetical protein